MARIGRGGQSLVRKGMPGLLRDERVSDAFIEYLDGGWASFVQ